MTRQSTKGIRRAAAPGTLNEAMDRVWHAKKAVRALKSARTAAYGFPHTRRYIDRCIKSAEGALRHARALESRFRR
jgi:hypothetical protein